MLAQIHNKILIIILLIIFIIGCVKEKDHIRNNNFQLVVYTNPEKDCVTCILTAIKLVDKSLNVNDGIISIFVKKKMDRFERFIHDEFPNKKFEFLEKELKIPHPSIGQIYNGKIIMYLYILNDHLLFEESLKQLKKFINANINNE